MVQKLGNLTIPKELDYTAYTSAKDRIVERFHTTLSPEDFNNALHPYPHYLGAWNAVLYRSIAVVEFDWSFTRSVQKHSVAPKMMQRCEQDNLLLVFFVSGLSAMESAFYGLYAVGALLRSDAFSHFDKSRLKQITPKSTTETFEKVYPKDDLTLRLRTLTEDSTYKEWGDVRNVLTHRAAPGRNYFQGGSQSGQSILKHVLPANNFELNEETTSKRCKWFFEQVNSLLGEINNFVRTNV